MYLDIECSGLVFRGVNKLTMQASLVAFQRTRSSGPKAPGGRSEGACRPYGQGPFPAEDCDVQCRVTGLDAARWPGHVAPEPPGRPATRRGARHGSRVGSVAAMGTGASAAKGMASAVNEMDDAELNAVVEKLDTDTCQVIQKAGAGELKLRILRETCKRRCRKAMFIDSNWRSGDWQAINAKLGGKGSEMKNVAGSRDSSGRVLRPFGSGTPW